MSCPYYWWDNHYACRKSGKDVNEDIYYKYCRNYDYDDCPIYKGHETTGCFLTSACVEAEGLSDDCRELTILRNFRDEYLKNLPGGADEIAEYYFIAPQIVSAIRNCSDAKALFHDIYEKVVRPCVEFIEQGMNEAAHQLYRKSVLEMKAKYICMNCAN